jgi:acetylornithine deacetylase/succinyl-diaminopimelate desuccinylase-like protein
MNSQQLEQFINQTWDQSIVPTISRYIEIPCKSPFFDKDWEKNGYIAQAMQLLADWCKEQQVPGMQLKVHQLPGRTPLLFIEVPGDYDKTVVMYGHMDKQPEMVGWHEGLGPWKAVLKEGRLYGRGGADDGYAVFSALTAIKALKQQGIPHARCVIIIEGSEESGSIDLPAYVDHLQKDIGQADLIICLDSGADNYDQLWCTTSLRGLVAAQLTVEILTEGVHSGAASGVVPSSFRILRKLLDRIENVDTGEILLKEFHVDIPENRVAEAEHAADILQDEVWNNYPWVEGARPAAIPGAQMILNRTWKPTLSITGVDGIPPLQSAGNVLRPQTSVMLSVRIPPYCEPNQAAETLKRVLEADPPFGAKVSVTFPKNTHGTGWNAPELQPWLATAIDQASQTFYQKPAAYHGEGGSIPFMFMLGEKFPQAQFMITGVLGPHSNAHGPNEFLHIDMAKRLTCCVASVIESHGKNVKG